MQTGQILSWRGMTDTEHTTSGSNEEGAVMRLMFAYDVKVIRRYH